MVALIIDFIYSVYGTLPPQSWNGVCETQPFQIHLFDAIKIYY